MNVGRIKLLLVDDDRVDRLAFEREASERDFPYDYRMASSVAEAKEMLSLECFDVVLMDYMLGDGTAFDLIEWLNDAPFVIITGSGDEAVAVNAMKLGAHDYLIKDPERNFLKILPLTVENVIVRREAERELHEKEIYISSILDGVLEGVIVVDEGGIVQSANPGAAGIFGYTVDEMKGLPVTKLIPLAFVVADDGEVSECLKTGKVRMVDYAYEAEGLRKDGAAFPISFSISEMWVRGMHVFIVIFRDITEHRRLEGMLREQSIRDGLTGLYNRRAMATIMREEMERSQRSNCRFAVMMLDVDHFKAVNDGFGHHAGDDVLRGVARVIQENIRSPDKPVRYGGEEVLVVLPMVDREGAAVLAERLRARIAGYAFSATGEGGDPHKFNVTVSIGISCYPEDGSTEDQLVRVADHALYEAKRGGRNRVVAGGGVGG